KKTTPNVRKILQSQKNIKNHLDDEAAMIALRQESQTQPSARSTAAKRKSLVALSSATPAPETTDSLQATQENVDPLLATKTLEPPSEAEIEALLSAPPLSYAAARAAPPDPNGPPQRYFCEQ
ncbi:hypothetical protein LTS18_002493, partial [Coniosporium uncinatum]